ncbi:uncharacterized protein LOC125662463 [Ostrea edulis]|uniref:uncharacterized protein LOC125662463 n=1 Tax=Ostrea edulis TaxID=37623 RepID=UPI0024AF25B3|nr:uncharacterized protein LOC125662463 [Ostrea edulis]
MSEDAMDLLLQDDPNDHAFSINMYMVLTSQYLVGSSQVSSASDSLLANPDMRWKDADVKDTETPDPRTVAFHSECQPDIQLIWDPIIQRTTDFIKLFLTENLVFSICIATTHYVEMVISRGKDCHYASQGNSHPFTEEELYRFLCIILYMSAVKFQSIDRYGQCMPLSEQPSTVYQE